MAMDEVDYEINGTEMQFVEVEHDSGEAAVGDTLICQRDAFVYAAMQVSLGTALQCKLFTGFTGFTGFFGGESSIMQKLEGDGMAFVHAGGTVVKRELEAGQTLNVGTGCVVGHTPDVNFEIPYGGKIKTAVFGGDDK